MHHVRIIHRGGTIERVKVTDDAGQPTDFECVTHDLAEPPGRFCEFCGAGPTCAVCGRDDARQAVPDMPAAELLAAHAAATRPPTDPTDLLTVDEALADPKSFVEGMAETYAVHDSHTCTCGGCRYLRTR